MNARNQEMDRLHDSLGRKMRDPVETLTFEEGLGSVDSMLFDYRADRSFWEALGGLGLRLLVTREYEHLVMALGARSGRPEISYFPLPHPSGLVADPSTGGFHVACTRNPNMLMEFRPAGAGWSRRDLGRKVRFRGELMPIRTRFLPGCLYLHDLAWIGRTLHGNAVGQNAVVSLSYDREPRHVWWPRAISRKGPAAFGRNSLQLNSIAAGKTLRDSFFSASCDRPGPKVPGDPDFPVDGRGVIFSGRTREPAVTGLTRPHSARLHRGRLWVANSGYGELGTALNGRFSAAIRLPGWTRGLLLAKGVLFVGTSRVLSRFRAYAPGLDPERCVCAVHALEISSGRRIGSLVWPQGNQIFAIDALPARATPGFPFPVEGKERSSRIISIRDLFHTFRSD